MRPLSLRARSYGPFEELDVVYQDGCTVILGDVRDVSGVDSNGAGKSHVLNAPTVALYGPPDGVKLRELLTDDGVSTELMVELTFEHAGETYRVRRGYSTRGAGKPTLDLERFEGVDLSYPAEWLPLTRESVKATQHAIVDLIGISRETFVASCVMVQGEPTFADPSVTPAEKKRRLFDAIGVDIWASALKLVRDDMRDDSHRAHGLAGRIATLTETAGDPARIEGELATARTIADDAGKARDIAEEELAAASERVREIEGHAASWARVRSDLLHAQAATQAHNSVREQAEQAREEAARVDVALYALGAPVAIAALEAREAELLSALDIHRAHVAAREEAIRSRDLIERQVAAISADAHQRRGKITDLEQRIAHLQAEGPGDTRCDLCLQTLGAEALQATVSNLRAQTVTLDGEAAALEEEQANSTPLPEIPVAMEPPAVDGVPAELVLAQLRQRIATARDQVGERARLEERLRGCREKIAAAEAPEYLEQTAALTAALTAAQQALDAIEEPEPGALDQAKAAALTARARIEEERLRYDSARALIARLEERLAQARRIADDLAAARAELDQAQARLDDLTILERAYGHGGIPTLIIEQVAIPSIEQEASRILAVWGTGYRVELRTQRAKQDGGLSESLDVVIVKENGVEQPYKLFSGGEATRIGLALQIAFARLLRQLRGADLGLFALDEPTFLDATGMGKLVELLRDLETEFPCIQLVSHIAELRDSFDNAITVTKNGNRSEVSAA